MRFLILITFCMNIVLGATRNKIPKIGIVGGGIGGTSCSFFLKNLFGESGVDIDLYEAEKIGGRLSVVDFAGNTFEEGGSIIHSRNKYMVDFLEKFGLKKRQNADGYFALYDGSHFVFSESEWQAMTLWNVVYRYGFGFWKLRSYIDEMLTKFEKIYDLQDKGTTFSTVGAMLAAMDPRFSDYLHVTTKRGFEKDGISGLVVDEIIMAANRANYGQALNIHKMVGSVSVAGAIGGLWAVHGGNFRVPENLVKASEANLINRVVTSIQKLPTGQIQVKTKARSDQDDNVAVYDVVILATPQTSDSKYKIEFENFDDEIKFAGKYHKTICTLVEGDLSKNYFPNKEPFIDEILTTKKDVVFNSIGRIAPVDYEPKKYGKSSVWKVFSQNDLNEVELSALFSPLRKKYIKEWLAYPDYDHSYRNDSFVLAPNLFHINAIEWAASAMEMSAIGAKNVALLTYKYLKSDEHVVSKPRVKRKDEL